MVTIMDSNKRIRRRPTRFTEDTDLDVLKPKKKTSKRNTSNKTEKIHSVKVSASVKISRGSSRSKGNEKAENIKIGRQRYNIDDIATLSNIISNQLQIQRTETNRTSFPLKSFEKLKVSTPGNIDWEWVSSEAKKKRNIDFSSRECQRIWLYLAYGKISSEYCVLSETSSTHSLTRIAESDFKAVIPNPRSKATPLPHPNPPLGPPPPHPVLLGEALEDYEKWEQDVIHGRKEEPGDVVNLVVQAGMCWNQSDRRKKRELNLEPSGDSPLETGLPQGLSVLGLGLGAMMPLSLTPTPGCAAHPHGAYAPLPVPKPPPQQASMGLSPDPRVHSSSCVSQQLYLGPSLNPPAPPVSATTAQLQGHGHHQGMKRAVTGHLTLSHQSATSGGTSSGPNLAQFHAAQKAKVQAAKIHGAVVPRSSHTHSPHPHMHSVVHSKVHTQAQAQAAQAHALGINIGTNVKARQAADAAAQAMLLQHSQGHCGVKKPNVKEVTNAMHQAFAKSLVEQASQAQAKAQAQQLQSQGAPSPATGSLPPSVKVSGSAAASTLFPPPQAVAPTSSTAISMGGASSKVGTLSASTAQGPPPGAPPVILEEEGGWHSLKNSPTTWTHHQTPSSGKLNLGVGGTATAPSPEIPVVSPPLSGNFGGGAGSGALGQSIPLPTAGMPSLNLSSASFYNGTGAKGTVTDMDQNFVSFQAASKTKPNTVGKKRKLTSKSCAPGIQYHPQLSIFVAEQAGVQPNLPLHSFPKQTQQKTAQSGNDVIQNSNAELSDQLSTSLPLQISHSPNFQPPNQVPTFNLTNSQFEKDRPNLLRILNMNKQPQRQNLLHKMGQQSLPSPIPQAPDMFSPQQSLSGLSLLNKTPSASIDATSKQMNSTLHANSTVYSTQHLSESDQNDGTLVHGNKGWANVEFPSNQKTQENQTLDPEITTMGMVVIGSTPPAQQVLQTNL